MKHENFLSIKLLDERVVGKETYLFRYEIISNGPVQYCVRNSKYKKIISALNRSSLDVYKRQRVHLLRLNNRLFPNCPNGISSHRKSWISVSMPPSRRANQRRCAIFFCADLPVRARRWAQRRSLQGSAFRI